MTIAAAAKVAAVFVAIVLIPADIADVPPVAATVAAAAPAAPPAPAEAVMPNCASSAFLKNSSGATGRTEASALFVLRSCALKPWQRSQPRT